MDRIVKKKGYRRKIVAYSHYFKDFKKTLSRDVLCKVYQVFLLIMTEEVIPVRFFKSITGVKGLYEIRIEEGGNIYRIFCCLDEGYLVILLSAFQKKTQKTPGKEIERAVRIMSEYYSKYMKMTDSELKALGCTDIEEMISEDFGVPGTDEREAFDREAETFILAERLKEERRKAGLTQEQLAAKIGTKKSYISRIENGKTDVQLSTLFKIFQGLGKRVSITIL